jgi:hypothetical protein
MKNIKEYIKLMITSHSGISSKRVCGVLGFLVITFVIIFCTVTCIEAPAILDTFIWAVCTLLGIDSVTGIWKDFNNRRDV